jgi:DNA-binding transcriptional ArsR family regulator
LVRRARQHGGLLFSDDPTILFERLEQLGASVPVDPAVLTLRSETAEDRQAVLERLSRLRASAGDRARYAEVLRDLWAAVALEWERRGRPSVEAAVAARRQLLGRGASLEEVARNDCTLVEELFAEVVGVRADGTSAFARARTEALARRLKAMSDPTRPAILDTLQSWPRTVTEIAASFSLAQPTVSNHVKILRQAGFLAEQRVGTRHNLVVRAEAVDDVLGDLSEVLRPGATPVALDGFARPS